MADLFFSNPSKNQVVTVNLVLMDELRYVVVGVTEPVYWNGKPVDFFQLNKDGSYHAASTLPKDCQKLMGKRIKIVADNAIYHVGFPGYVGTDEAPNDCKVLEVDNFEVL